MLRVTLFAVLLATGCRHDIDRGPENPKPVGVVPLPPASGTPIGYLVDNATQMKLTDEQLKKLKELDTSLAATDDEIDTQLRQIEKPEEEPPEEKGAPHHAKNMAPGKNTVTTKDSEKLHQMRKQNDREALRKAYAVLDPDQQAEATKILQDHGVESPLAPVKHTRHDDSDGVPMEP
jgi:hypothetical protein